ncbi:MAG: MTH1187 family thiamine-binding protein [Campylobacterota bacterium]|nr:MTH1187 family thiamine-binding protein [Campylobacterota bacterium]
MFPSDVGESKSKYVSEVVKVVKESGHPYQLTPMATIVESDNIKDALSLVEKCYNTLDAMGCNRVYSVLKFDIRNNQSNRLETKIKSVEDKIGEVRK